MAAASVEKHLNLYKFKTPPLKETLRRRCYQRLKDCRQKSLGQFRSCSDSYTELDSTLQQFNQIVDDMITKELKKMQTYSDDRIPQDLNEDEVFRLMEEIQLEMKKEQSPLLEYDVDEALLSQIEWFEREDVICPLCQRSILQQTDAVIHCNCGLFVNIPPQCQGLGYVKSHIETEVTMHDSQCYEAATFSKSTSLQGTNVVITCNACGYNRTVL